MTFYPDTEPTLPTSAPPTAEPNPFAQLNPPPPQHIIMVAFEDTDEPDTGDLYQKCAAIKLPFSKNIKLWFQQLETKMRFIGVKSQFLKLQVLTDRLPSEVAEEVKDLLYVTEDTATATCYKVVKVRLLDIYGPKEEEDIELATSLVLTSTPSQLARRIVDLVCEGTPKLEGCHCPKLVLWLWKKRLPEQVKAGIADMSFKNGGFEATIKHADAIYNTLGINMATAKVASASLNTNETADDPQLAAYTRGRGNRGRGNAYNNRGKHNQGQGRGNRGGSSAYASRGASNGNAQNTPNPTSKKGTKSADNPPDSCCYNHWVYGKQAWNCLNPTSCPWKDYYTPRPSK